MTDRFSQAEQEYKRLIQTQPDSPAGYMGLIQIASLQLNWESALECWNACLEKFPHLMGAQGLFAKMRVLLELEMLEEAGTLVRDLVARFPDYFGGYYGLALVANAERDWAGALQHLDICLSRFSGPMDAEWLAFRAHLLGQLKRFAEAEQLALDLIRKYPGCPEGYVELARLAEQLFNPPLTYERWAKAYRLFPEHKRCACGYIDCLSDQGEFELAQSLCREHFEKTGDLGFQLCLVDSLLYQPDAGAALHAAEALIEAYPDNLELKLKKIDVLIGHGQQEQAAQAVAFAEELRTRFPDSLKVHLKLIDSCIFAGRHGLAQEQLNRLLPRTGEPFETSQLRAWQHAMNGDIGKARELYRTAINHDAYVAALQAPLNLKRIDNRPLDHAAGELFLFSCVKNNVRPMPWYLDHYRKIGVRRFFIVDNGSTDGTTAFLLQQPDVHLFWTEDAFYPAASGLRWMNHLISEYGEGHWCILADSDEILVVPGVEKQGLIPLLKYMESNGQEALRVCMLDMFPETSTEFSSFPSNGNLLEHSPFFDNSLRHFGTPRCPYTLVRGGVRERLFGGIEVLEKVAIIRGGDAVQYLTPHTITPAVLSDVTGVYLHFTLAQKPELADDSEQITGDSRIDSRSGVSRRRYSRYQRILSTMAKHQSNLCAVSERYIDSDQLLELGLMAKPEGFFCS